MYLCNKKLVGLKSHTIANHYISGPTYIIFMPPPPFEEGRAYRVAPVCRAVHKQIPFIFIAEDALIEMKFNILICYNNI